MKTWLRLLLIPLILTVSVTAAYADNGNGRDKPIHLRTTLTPSQVFPNANGFAEIFFHALKKKTLQTLHVHVEGLKSNTPFQLIVNDNILETFNTNPGGTFDLIFDSKANGSHLPFPPIINPALAPAPIFSSVLLDIFEPLICFLPR